MSYEEEDWDAELNVDTNARLTIVLPNQPSSTEQSVGNSPSPASSSANARSKRLSLIGGAKLPAEEIRASFINFQSEEGTCSINSRNDSMLR